MSTAGTPSPAAAGAPRFVLGRRPALDGVRAVAVTLVVAQHVGDLLVDTAPSFGGGPFVPGGFLGVDLFFVLSGFLITGLLLQSWDDRGGLDLPGFYLRRALRLLPALLAVLAATTAYVAVTARDLGPHLRGVAAATFYVWNWAVAFGRDVGDFGHGHLWSLAIEEQFYLVWPALLAVSLVASRRRARGPLLLCLAGLVATVLARRVVVETGALGAAYVRTDTRLDGLMLGAALAVALRAGWRPPAALRALAPVALVGVVGLALTVTVADRWLYVWGFPAVAVLGTVVVAGAVFGSPAHRLLTWPAAVWLGQRSYALYLVHYPVFQATGEQLDGQPAWCRVVVGLALAAVGTLACHHGVERPVLRWRDRRWPRPHAEAEAVSGVAGPGPAPPTR